MTAKLSVVISTVGSPDRISRFSEVISHLRNLKPASPEIVIVWQGDEDCKDFDLEGVNIIKVPFFGLSMARNFGASQTTGDYLMFLDDDTYPVGSDFFQRSLQKLKDKKWDFLVCNIRSEGKLKAAREISSDLEFSRRSIVGNFWEPALLIPKNIFHAIEFDESLGIGCVHGASEGLDFGLRLLNAGFRGGRAHNLHIDHPPLQLERTPNLQRAFFYSMGNGAVLAQHQLYLDYARQISRAMLKLGGGALLLRGHVARAAWVRVICLLLGPAVPRGRPRILPTPAGPTASSAK